MDPTRFDALVRSLATEGTRRRILAVLAALPLGGLLALDADEAGAERPHERAKRRNKQHQRKKRNQRRRKHHNTKNKHKGGKGSGNPNTCTPNGKACQQNGDCCGGNCFGQDCADPVTACDGAACPPGATGCCAGTCCESPTNQCNALGECCAPNCDGKQCGPDGCGNRGACGACSDDLTCDESSGTCLCTAENCPDGCCSNGPGNPGTCELGDTVQQCGAGGAHCAHCANTQTCQGKQCVACTDGCICAGQSACLTPNAPNAYCDSTGICYCAVTRAGAPVCASGAIQVRNGCQTDQDCVDAFAGAYCIGSSNQLQSPCIFGQSFCAGACNP